MATIAEKATTAKRTTSKAKTPPLLFSEGQTVYATHARLHPAESSAKVMADYTDGPTVTFIKLAFEDTGEVITVHKKRIKSEPTPAEPTAA